MLKLHAAYNKAVVHLLFSVPLNNSSTSEGHLVRIDWKVTQLVTEPRIIGMLSGVS